MAVTRIIDGKRVTLTPRQAKAYVLERTGWSSEKYNREYDKFRNRVRNYERLTEQETGTISAADEFYRVALKESYAKQYDETPSYTTLQKSILATTTAGTRTRLSTSQQQKAIKTIEQNYEGLLRASQVAQTKYAEFQKMSPDASAGDLLTFFAEIKKGIEEAMEEELKAGEDFYERYDLEPDTP